MSMVSAVAAWYPDPGDPNCVRWWDGHQWTPHTRPAVPGMGGQATSGQPVGGVNLHNAPARVLNHYSLITFGVGALYLMLAFVTHFVLIGFIPLALAMRAKRAGEPLAPLAIAAAVGVIFISLLTLFH